MQTNYEIITGLLTLLSEDDLEKTSKVIDSLLQNKTSQPEENKNIQLFYKILNDACLGKHPPLSIIRKNHLKLYLRIKETILYLDENLESIIFVQNKKTKIQHEKVIITKTIQIIFYVLFVKTITSRLKILNAPATLKNVVNNHNKFIALLEHEFPGYLRAGMFVPCVLLKQSVGKAQAGG